MPYDVVAVGTVNLDMIVIGDAPRDMESLLEWVDVSRVEMMAAGSMGYCAIDMARLGLSVAAFSSVGGDLFGEWIVRQLQSEGLDTAGISVEKDKISGLAIYMLLFGSRKRPLTGRLGTHAPWPSELSSENERLLRDARLLHCGGYLHYPLMWGAPTELLFRKAKEFGLKTSLDTQFPMSPVEEPWIRHFGDLLDYVDVIFTDDVEARSITGKSELEHAAHMLLEHGAELVVVKKGAEGALLATPDRIVNQPAYPPDHFEDSIGAGDAFDAGVIYGILQGWDLDQTARFAAMTASCTLKGIGGNATAPTAKEVLAMIEQIK